MDYHVEHIFKWLTGDEVLNKRYREICNDTRISYICKIKYLKELVFVREHVIDWDALLKLGKERRDP